MKKYNIHQEIPMPPPMQESGIVGTPLEHMMSSIDRQHEFSEENKQLTAQLEAVKQLVTRLESDAASIKAISDKIDAQANTWSSIINSLCTQTDKLKTIIIRAILTPESMHDMDKYVNEILKKEKELLSQHRTFLQQEWESNNNNLKSIIRDNKGIWLSSKVYWWAIAIFELLFCLAAYFGGNALIATVR